MSKDFLRGLEEYISLLRNCNLHNHDRATCRNIMVMLELMKTAEEI